MEDHDEKAIRDLVTTWLQASKVSDLATLLSLMADDIVFMVPGREPFGKEEFAAGIMAMKGALLEATSEIVELKLMGDWAWMRNRLRVILTTPAGPCMAHRGYTLTILRKNQDGKWVIARDANLLTLERNVE